MSALDILIQLLKLFEGCRLTSYKDIVGIWTIGYGETKDVQEGMTWTQDEADQHLSDRAQQFINGVIAACPQLNNEPAYRQAACASLAYNIGLHAFSISTVCRETTAQDYDAAQAAFAMWSKAGGVIRHGLEIRRDKESKIYKDGGSQ